jgi:hemerythrin-like domain-containing protein
MMPIGPLMKEHRIIERMLPAIRRQIETLEKDGCLDVLLATKLRDFIRTYADRCHHGKEEDILFADLEARDDLPDDLRATMEALKEDHRRGRALTAKLGEARDATLYGNGREGAALALEALGGLEDLYPGHIDTEDNAFFRPAMELLSEEEQQEMIRRMQAFENTLFHDTYEEVVEALHEQEPGSPGRCAGPAAAPGA